MRWRKQKPGDKAEWRRWFAWYPVSIGDQRVWLEHVECQGTLIGYMGGGMGWQYKFRLPEAGE